MRKVAVSQRMDTYPDRNETRDALDQRFSAFLYEAGFLPVPVSNTFCTSEQPEEMHRTRLQSWLAAVNPSGVILTGGNDVGSVPVRDYTENQLCDYALDLRLPVLGICRGMQAMSAWAGAGLKKVSGHVGSRHKLKGQINTVVNSYHEHALADCPTDFEVMACSEDDEIEAIRHKELNWEGWMWHPEREERFGAGDIQRLQHLFVDRA